MEAHDLGPPVHRRADEDGHERADDIVELGHAEIEFLEICVLPSVVRMNG